MSFDLNEAGFDKQGTYLEEAALRYEHALMEQFAASPEGQAIKETGTEAAAVQRRDVEQARTYVDEVITILAHGSSGFLREGLRTLPHRVDQHGGQTSVEALDQYIRQQLQLPEKPRA